MARRPLPSPHLARASVTLPHDRALVDDLVKRVTDATSAAGYSPTSTFAVRLAMEEAISNAFRHGHQGLDPRLTITVSYDIGPQRIELSVKDQGPGFKPEAVPDPTLDENLERPSGRGLMLMKAYMTSITYSAKGNEVRLVYDKPSANAKSA